MVTHALYAPLEAKPDKAEELQAFLREAQVLAEQEPGTAAWFALRMGPTIAEALMAKADELLANPPQIHQLDVIASKL